MGGGCRRNKRSKSSSSKSPASSDRQNNPSSTSAISTNSGSTANILGLTPPQLPPLRFMSPLGQLMTDNLSSDHMGLNYSGITAPAVGTNEMNFHGASNLLGASLLSNEGGGIEPWRLQQFPFLSGLDTSSSPGLGIYQFHGGGESGFMGGETSQSHQVRPKLSSSSMLTQLTSVKMEDHPDQHNLSRQLLGGGGGGMTGINDQWNAPTANWTELSSFSSSSTSNAL